MGELHFQRYLGPKLKKLSLLKENSDSALSLTVPSQL
jgi:hypothetical protein